MITIIATSERVPHGPHEITFPPRSLISQKSLNAPDMILIISCFSLPCSLSLHGEEENYYQGKSLPVDPWKKKKELLSDDTLISLMKIID
jgi:hypothetical protein